MQINNETIFKLIKIINQTSSPYKIIFNFIEEKRVANITLISREIDFFHDFQEKLINFQ